MYYFDERWAQVYRLRIWVSTFLSETRWTAAARSFRGCTHDEIFNGGKRGRMSGGGGEGKAEGSLPRAFRVGPQFGVPIILRRRNDGVTANGVRLDVTLRIYNYILPYRVRTAWNNEVEPKQGWGWEKKGKNGLRNYRYLVRPISIYIGHTAGPGAALFRRSIFRDIITGDPQERTVVHASGTRSYKRSRKKKKKNRKRAMWWPCKTVGNQNVLISYIRGVIGCYKK